MGAMSQFMLEIILIILAAIYLVALCVLAVYGVNFLYLTAIVLWQNPAKNQANPQQPMHNAPSVTVQLPIFNEMYVAERLINAAAQLNYPAPKLHIQVLDDSTDETARIISTAVAHWQSRGVNISHVQRPQRIGYKAGALAYGLTLTDSPFIAIFDADFLPPPDYLQHVMLHFTTNPADKIAFVQARWGHLNRTSSLLSILQAMGIDGHFAIEQQARSQRGHIFNFNGTAGVWRRAAIEDAGGWTADTLTEDLDLSYRAALKGWRGVYLDQVEVAAELPDHFAAFRRQQRRWAFGSFQTARKLLPAVMASALPLRHKSQAALHLTAYTIQLWMALVSLLYLPLLLIISWVDVPAQVFNSTWLFNITAFAPTLMFMVAQMRRGRGWAAELPRIFLLSGLGAGMMLNTCRAALQLFSHQPHAFERTPKSGAGFDITHPAPHNQYTLGLDRIVFAELAFALWNGLSLVLALQLGLWGVAFYAGLFAVGLAAVAIFTIMQSFRL